MTLERPRRYIPASPSIAFQSLVLHRQKELQQVQFAVEQLQDDMARQHPEGEHILELITSREAERQIFEQMQLTAKQEFFAVDRKLPAELRDRWIELDTLDVRHESDRRTARQIGIAILRDLHVRTGVLAEQRVGLLRHLLNRIYPHAVRFKGFSFVSEDK